MYSAYLNIHCWLNITNITAHSPDDGSVEPKRYRVNFSINLSFHLDCLVINFSLHIVGLQSIIYFHIVYVYIFECGLINVGWQTYYLNFNQRFSLYNIQFIFHLLPDEYVKNDVSNVLNCKMKMWKTMYLVCWIASCICEKWCFKYIKLQDKNGKNNVSSVLNCKIKMWNNMYASWFSYSFLVSLRTFQYTPPKCTQLFIHTAEINTRGVLVV